MTVRDLLVDLCAEHLDAVTGEPVPLQALVGLLAACGVAEPSTRVAVAALRRTGWLTAVRRGRETLCAPAAPLREAVTAQRERIDRRLGPWDGQWRMVVYSVPETDRAARERVRQGLARAGFGPLAPATWVSPHRCALDEVHAELAGEHTSRLDLLIASVADPRLTDGELAARCWDLPRFAAGWTRVLDRLRASAAAGTPDGPAALGLHLRLRAETRAVLAGDPLLPPVLQPPGWPARDVRDAWADAGARLAAAARAHVADVLGVVATPPRAAVA
ncbi:phenylacetic acid degradation operon negative regulatory protein [Geodermatophilus bullaregiensis]|uniref:PaaX family transcriptional regulator C-terminal domain-containing protein n=1 Tax=Geodermatophilus bullaregiensis TaxID=1564160 RepID=UPI00195EE019|nr:PaaX family transcriptional regulator C-terminal domain-containing protein [Geodermatophilus bullaregiensis]MBM7806538.1 phenylacetic acid degradation operon negative regulatory protein [Geodermatophilus bullaregiensis]